MSCEITILGCGSSSGVPAIGNNWGNCNPKNPKNRRLRSSILIKNKNTIILIDATPDLRQQLLNANVKKIDAVLVTHTHVLLEALGVVHISPSRVSRRPVGLRELVLAPNRTEAGLLLPVLDKTFLFEQGDDVLFDFRKRNLDIVQFAEIRVADTRQQIGNWIGH